MKSVMATAQLNGSGALGVLFLFAGMVAAAALIIYTIYRLWGVAIEQDRQAREQARKLADDAWRRAQAEQQRRVENGSASPHPSRAKEEARRLLELVGVSYSKTAAKFFELRTFKPSTAENAERRRYEGLSPPPMHSLRTRKRVATQQSEILNFLREDPCGLLLLMVLHERQKIWGIEERVLQRNAVRSLDSFGEYLARLGDCVESDHYGSEKWADHYLAAREELEGWCRRH